MLHPEMSRALADQHVRDLHRAPPRSGRPRPPSARRPALGRARVRLHLRRAHTAATTLGPTPAHRLGRARDEEQRRLLTAAGRRRGSRWAASHEPHHTGRLRRPGAVVGVRPAGHRRPGLPRPARPGAVLRRVCSAGRWTRTATTTGRAWPGTGRGWPWRSSGRRGTSPPSWPDGAPQQLHLDLTVEDMAAAHARAVELGARPLDPEADPAGGRQRGFRVYADPAGHPFCLCR